MSFIELILRFKIDVKMKEEKDVPVLYVLYIRIPLILFQQTEIATFSAPSFHGAKQIED